MSHTSHIMELPFSDLLNGLKKEMKYPINAK